MAGTDAIPARLEPIRDLARDIARSVAAEHAEEVDREARWPRETISALGEAGLMGLHVSADLGGRGEGMLALALVTEELGRVCASSALVYGMHCVATEVIATNATARQADRYLEPIAAGRHVTSLALSEPGTGVHFYIPRATFREEGDGYVVNGIKAFVTSGGRADSYVLSVVAEGATMDPGTFSCMLVEADAPGITWSPPWDGLGMRGNSSRGMQLDDVPVASGGLLGSEGDETWYLFEVIAPYFIVAMAGSYLGVAQSALDEAVRHLSKRSYEHTGERVGTASTVAHRLGETWSVVERSRQLIYHAARLGDAQAPAARPALFAAKAEMADAVVRVANDAMTLTGGIAYGRGGVLSRALRDARASHIMSPSTDLLKTWLGRSLLDLPLL